MSLKRYSDNEQINGIKHVIVPAKGLARLEKENEGFKKSWCQFKDRVKELEHENKKLQLTALEQLETIDKRNHAMRKQVQELEMLKELLLDVSKSFEFYTAETNNFIPNDEYEEMMFPIWQRVKKLKEGK